ncbi:MAG: hypothetical protein PHO32_04760 [Candidatus Cloacimonetes bacterium]|nr:hypothetical protein [Candidatus Cloacimonadota bacterium]
MQKILLVLCLLASLSFGAYAITIYNVQFTTLPGSDGTYPSRYVNKSVSLEGIVTATNYKSGGYFISEPLNGPWRGIFILDRDAKVKTGDRVSVSGIVSETFGMTCLTDLTQTKILGSANSLPQPILLTTGQLSRADEAEAYEGVYARLLNSTTSSSKNQRGKIIVTDGTGFCTVNTGFFGDRGFTKQALSSAQYSSITGIVLFGYSEFSLGTIDASDVVIHQPTFIQNRSWGKIKSIYK